MIHGFATLEGTGDYRSRFPAAAAHFRRMAHVPGAGELWLPSLGLGTYLGEPDAAADDGYVQAITEAVRLGINLLDTAVNYRHQRSERNIGTALARMVAAGEVQRDGVVVCTKAGYISFDGDPPVDAREYFTREYLETGVIEPEELVAGVHCMTPRYLSNQLERSRRNLGLETVDVFYLHNPETQLSQVSRDEFRRRLHEAFAFCETAVSDGKIRWYGMATWNAFRLARDERDWVGLEETVKIAAEAGGADHHFRFIQLPFNLGMLEAYGMHNQPVNGHQMSPVEAAARLGIAVVGSATLSQGQLAKHLPEALRERLGVNDDAQAAIQFARSAPGMATALVGMGKAEHVRRNAVILAGPLMAEDDFAGLFVRQ